MSTEEPRALIERLASERGDDFAALSRLIGRNAAYIQQFIRRGTPARLREEDRRTLAEHFGIDESLLGGIGYPARKYLDVAMVPVRQYDAAASAGPGAHADEDRVLAAVDLPERWARRLAGGDPSMLSIIAVRGDSMAPTLADGDDLLVNRADASDRLRDGVYVLRVDDALVVKRIAINPASRRFTIRSDNPGYPDWPDCRPGDVEVIGRVVWAGRRFA